MDHQASSPHGKAFAVTRSRLNSRDEGSRGQIRHNRLWLIRRNCDETDDARILAWACIVKSGQKINFFAYGIYRAEQIPTRSLGREDIGMTRTERKGDPVTTFGGQTAACDVECLVSTTHPMTHTECNLLYKWQVPSDHRS